MYALDVYKNGSFFKRIDLEQASGSGTPLGLSGAMHDLAADGDTYRVNVFHTVGSTTLVDGTPALTYVMGNSGY